MNGQCPSKECHEKMDGHHRTLYGEDGRSGLVGEVKYKVDKTCLSKYIPKPNMTLFCLMISAILIPAIITGIKVWKGSEVSDYIYLKKEYFVQRNEVVDRRLTILESQLDMLKDDVHELKVSLNQGKAETREGFSTLADLIKKK